MWNRTKETEAKWLDGKKEGRKDKNGVIEMAAKSLEQTFRV